MGQRSLIHTSIGLCDHQGKGFIIFLITMLIGIPLSAQDHRVFADSCQACLQRNAFADALRYSQLGLEITIAKHGAHDTSTAELLVLHALAHGYQKQTLGRDSAFHAALDIRESILGRDHPSTWSLRWNWTLQLREREQAQEMQTLLEEPLRPYLEGKPIDLPEVAACLGFLASANYALGRFPEAEQACQRGLEGVKRTGYSSAFDHAYNVYLAGWLLIDVGKAQEAEDVLKRYIAIQESRKERNHNLARYYCVLGEARHSLGRVLEAEQAYLTAYRIFQELSSGHYEDVTVMANLGVLYTAMHRYSEAEFYMKRCIALMDTGSSELGRQLGNLSSVYMAQGRPREAEEACRTALAIQIRYFGKEHYLVSRTLHRLGTYLLRQGRVVEADSFLAEAWRVGTLTLPPRDDRMGRYSLWWGRSSLAQGNVNRADSLMRMAMKAHREHLYQYWTDLTEKEKSQFAGMLKANLEYFFSYVAQRKTASPDLVGALYDLTLACKAIVQQSTRLVQEHIQRSGDTLTQSLFRDWSLAKNRLAHLARHAGTSTARMLTDSLSSRAQSLEHELLVRSRAFAGALNPRPVTWREVRAQLGPRDAAAEIFRYREYDSLGTGKTRYGVLILKGNETGPPLMALIPEGDSLEGPWLKEYRKMITRPPDFMDSSPSSRGGTLYQRYWQPLGDQLDGIQRLWLATDGVYHQINPQVLVIEGKKSLFDSIELRHLVSTRSLTEMQPMEKPVPRRAVLLGAPDLRQPEKDSGADGKEKRWPPLRHSAKEVEGIASLLHSEGWKETLLTGSGATETAVKSIRQAGVVHLSTHGFFTEDTSTTGDPYLRELLNNVNYHNAYLQSGLVLARAHSGDVSEPDDGRLTAYEATSLNLEGTALVVLSACETGRGAVRNGEGVYGLQRAFLMAGARAVVMSLWKVEDGITKELMLEFYRAWLRDGDPYKALRNAMITLRKTRPYLSPADWGAFVVVS